MVKEVDLTKKFKKNFSDINNVKSIKGKVEALQHIIANDVEPYAAKYTSVKCLRYKVNNSFLFTYFRATTRKSSDIELCTEKVVVYLNYLIKKHETEPEYNHPVLIIYASLAEDIIENSATPDIGKELAMTARLYSELRKAQKEHDLDYIVLLNINRPSKNRSIFSSFIDALGMNLIIGNKKELFLAMEDFISNNFRAIK